MSSKYTATINKKPVSLALNLGRVLAGKENGSDLGDLDDGSPVTEMWMNPEILAKATWDVYQDRLKESAGIATQQEFFNLFDGECRRSIEVVMKEVIVDFFPWGQTIVDRLKKQMEKMSEESGPSGQTSTSAPGSSE